VIWDGLSVQVRVRTDDRRLYIGRKDKENGRTHRSLCFAIAVPIPDRETRRGFRETAHREHKARSPYLLNPTKSYSKPHQIVQ
jgi:hypothetical protein